MDAVEEHSGSLDIVAELVVLSDNVDPAVITTTLNVKPTKTWIRGDKVHPKSGQIRRWNGWVKRSPAERLITTPQKAVEELLNEFTDIGAFRLLPAGCRVQVTLALYGRTSRPYAYIPVSLLQRLATIGADLNVDTYDLTDVGDTPMS